MEFAHVSVMVREVVELLRPQPGRRYLDGTLGGGGHAESILMESSPDGELLGLDRDEEALAAARQRLERFGARVKIRQANFSAAGELIARDSAEEPLAQARQRLERFGARVKIRQANFSAAAEIMGEIGWRDVDGLVLDLGLSSHQLESAERGFSFRFSGALDMRMDRREQLDAYTIVNRYQIG